MFLKLDDIKKYFSSTTYVKGKAYYDEKRVENLSITNRTNITKVESMVNGTGMYIVTLTLKDNKISDAICTCPVGYKCKHCCAVAIKYSIENKDSQNVMAFDSLASFDNPLNKKSGSRNKNVLNYKNYIVSNLNYVKQNFYKFINDTITSNISYIDCDQTLDLIQYVNDEIGPSEALYILKKFKNVHASIYDFSYSSSYSLDCSYLGQKLNKLGYTDLSMAYDFVTEKTYYFDINKDVKKIIAESYFCYMIFHHLIKEKDLNYNMVEPYECIRKYLLGLALDIPNCNIKYNAEDILREVYANYYDKFSNLITKINGGKYTDPKLDNVRIFGKYFKENKKNETITVLEKAILDSRNVGHFLSYDNTLPLLLKDVDDDIFNEFVIGNKLYSLYPLTSYTKLDDSNVTFIKYENDFPINTGKFSKTSKRKDKYETFLGYSKKTYDYYVLVHNLTSGRCFSFELDKDGNFDINKYYSYFGFYINIPDLFRCDEYVSTEMKDDIFGFLAYCYSNEPSKETLNLHNQTLKEVNVAREEALKDEIKAENIDFINEINKNLTNTQVVDVINNIDLIPYVDKPNYENDPDNIRFKIGYDSYYFIKNLCEFISAVENEEVVSYGKKLKFKHSLNSFTPKAKEIIALLGSIFYANKQSIASNNFIMNNLIKICDGKVINFYGLDYVVSGEFEVKVIFDSEYETLKINIDGNKMLCLGESDYYLDDNNGNNYLKKVKYSSEYIKKMVRMLKDRPLDLRYCKDEFFQNIYPFVRREIDIPYEFKKDIESAALTIECYLDYYENEILLDTKYKLNENEISFSIAKSKFNNLITPYLKIINELGFINNKIIDQDAIFNFLNSNLDALHNEAIVYITDSLQQFRKEKLLNIKINIVKKDDSVINVFFSDLNYSNEELYKIIQAYKRKKKYILFNDSYIDLEHNDETLNDLCFAIDDFNLDPKDLTQEVENPLFSLFKLEGKYDGANIESGVRDIIYDIKNYQNSTYNLNDKIKSSLRPYQLNGFLWMRTLLNKGLGGVLADDMGIGKTLQSIAIIDSITELGPIYVICPKNVIYNWENEINTWAPHIDCIVINGNNAARQMVYKEIRQDRKCVYVVSYDVARRDIDIFKEGSTLVILDEAQNIKTPSSERSKAIRSIKSKYKLCLTGTPIENKMLDLWSIFDFLMPGYLYSYDRFMKLIENKKNAELLKSKVLPFVLRRTKDQVLTDLPPKTEEVVYVTMEDKQRKLYEAMLLKARDAYMTAGNKALVKSLGLLTRIRQACIDPNLFVDNYDGESCKTLYLAEIIPDLIENNHKMLIFSTFTSYLDIIQQILDYNYIKYYRIDGKTPAYQRQVMANDFNKGDDVKIFLVSLKAGGVGLNLVGADTVIHMDPWWNQAAETQASDRAYRLGQTKPLNVYKIVCKGTIEEKIIKIQKEKGDLAKAVIDENDEDFTGLENFNIGDLLY